MIRPFQPPVHAPSPPSVNADGGFASWGFSPGVAIAEGRTIIKPLGGGRYYEVFLVWDDRLFALMVAKILRPDHVENPAARSDLCREHGLLKRLAHPGLVRGFGAELDGRTPHLLLGHVEGPTLSRLIRRNGPLPLSRLLPIALYIAAVLRYLSAEGVVHLDVKASNIIMGAAPTLIDLSLARTLADAASMPGGIGSRDYMAPEQCDPAAFPGRIGAAADVWGLGAALYYAIAGRRPFDRPDVTPSAANYPQLTQAAPLLPPDTPVPLTALVGRMLARNPAERPAAGDVASALEELVADVGVQSGVR